MKAVLLKKLRRLQAQQGFTLLEILVVLTIMGFLIAMVAPRLAGISGGAVDTVCDSNQNRMVSYLGAYFEKTARFPDKLTNLVDRLNTGTSGAFQIPAVSDDNSENGAETLAAEFNERNHFRIHYLNASEAAELKSLGIANLFNLNAYDYLNEAGTAIKSDYAATAALATTLGVENPNEIDLAVPTNRGPAMEAVKVTTTGNTSGVLTTPLAVAMVGMGIPTNSGSQFTVTMDERGWGEPDFLGRIVLGMGPESSLITSGIISNAAHCPGGIQNAANVTYNDYNVVLPRLAATEARLDVTSALPAGMNPESLTAVSYDDEPDSSYNLATNTSNLRTRTFDITVAQESYQYATQCPEGHMYPEDDGEFWGISLDGDSTLD
ncbi:type II secretion system protein [Desulfuromonas thiophila]|uniref:type II secretion system protein n=1 Tax=Desulfuromonas thiophila TaxID=57664 RepID=UPI0029F5C3B5|nr:type II secretion system protein [Desulfuromonas thiophila]